MVKPSILGLWRSENRFNAHDWRKKKEKQIPRDASALLSCSAACMEAKVSGSDVPKWKIIDLEALLPWKNEILAILTLQTQISKKNYKN